MVGVNGMRIFSYRDFWFWWEGFGFALRNGGNGWAIMVSFGCVCFHFSDCCVSVCDALPGVYRLSGVRNG